MSTQESRKKDWIIDDGDTVHKGVVTPRVLLVEPNGYTPLIRHKNWLGLLGGHITESEANPIQIENQNLLRVDVLAPTVIREVQEESGVDITRFLRTQAAILGFAEVDIVDNTKHTITHAISPIVICKIPGNLPFNKNIVKVPPHHVPIHSYPDAAMALIYREQMHREGANGPIFPGWLNSWGRVVFETHPQKRYIHGAPPLEKLGFPSKIPEIPRSYAPHIRTWLQEQYSKL